MEMVFFLVFIAVCGTVIFFVSRGSKSKTDLGRRRKRKGFNAPDEKLQTRSDSVLGNRNELWKARREHVTQNVGTKQTFVLKSEAEKQPVYDGYSRRDRHHLASQAKAKEGKHSDGLIRGKEAIQARDLGQDANLVDTKHAAQT